MTSPPSTVNILGIEYTVEYVDKPSDVDIYKRESLWGQVDYWTRSIRIYNKRPRQDLWISILHEVIHALAAQLNIDEKVSDEGEVVGLLALGLMDVLVRNEWMEIEGREDESTG